MNRVSKAKLLIATAYVIGGAFMSNVLWLPPGANRVGNLAMGLAFIAFGIALEDEG